MNYMLYFLARILNILERDHAITALREMLLYEPFVMYVEVCKEKGTKRRFSEDFVFQNHIEIIKRYNIFLEIKIEIF